MVIRFSFLFFGTWSRWPKYNHQLKNLLVAELNFSKLNKGKNEISTPLPITKWHIKGERRLCRENIRCVRDSECNSYRLLSWLPPFLFYSLCFSEIPFSTEISSRRKKKIYTNISLETELLTIKTSNSPSSLFSLFYVLLYFVVFIWFLILPVPKYSQAEK